PVDDRVAVGWEVAVEVDVVAGDVEPCLVAVARHRGVAPFARQLLATQNEGAVDGDALGAVGGDRIAVIEIALLQRASRQLPLPAALDLNRDGLAVFVDPGHGPALAVEDLQLAI